MIVTVSHSEHSS